MVQCSVACCKNEPEIGKCSMFNLPKEPDVHHKWIEFLKMSGKIVYPLVNYAICQEHFQNSDVKSNVARKLLRK